MSDLAEFPSELNGLKRTVTGKSSVLYGQISSKPSGVVDLRSDTVTKPTDAMRVAMFEAEVGDDVLLNDPTVNLFQEKAARILGKEAALFLPSGTMGNLISVLVHCDQRGDEMLLGDASHLSVYEQGGTAFLGGVSSRVVLTHPDGRLDLDDLKKKILPIDIHCPVSKLVCIENTHNFKGGRILTPEYMVQVAELVKPRGLKIHLDGARLFNAATALKLPVAKLTESVDSVNVCLSKGLGAPVGSVIAGDKDFIAKARRLRKALGGGMRQAGVLAAPAIIAIEQGAQRLQEDHDNAQLLAEGLSKFADYGVKIDLSTVQTNIVFLDIVRDDMTAPDFVRLAREKGVLLLAFGDTSLRFVTNLEVTKEDIVSSLTKLEEILVKKY